jgi:hypothetical protein
LKELKDLILPWAYVQLCDQCVVPEDVLQLASSKELKGILGGWFGLVQQFHVWWQLLACQLPLPPLSCNYHKNDGWIPEQNHSSHCTQQ